MGHSPVGEHKERLAWRAEVCVSLELKSTKGTEGNSLGLLSAGFKGKEGWVPLETTFRVAKKEAIFPTATPGQGKLHY